MRAMQVDELMAEMGWVRRLARGLLRDGDAANDIAQDAWLVASEHAPEDGRPLRPWLHRVVTNLVRMRRRTETRRAARELTSGEERAVPSAEELLERVETQRVLAVEVTALREPYRSTLLLHYVEGLASAEIARRLGIPSATVRQRLKQGLDELRDRLRARKDGPKQGWLAALLPLAKVRPEPALALGALAMKKLVGAIVVIAILLLLGGIGWQRWRRPGAGGEKEQGPRDPAALAAQARGSAELRGGVGAVHLVLPRWFAQAGVPGRRVAGVVRSHDQAVAGATVRLAVVTSAPRAWIPPNTPGPAFAELAEVRTDASGKFDFGIVPAINAVVSAEADGAAPASISVPLAKPNMAPAPDQLVLLLGECRSRVVGTVRDATSPIAKARIFVAGLARVDADANGRFSACMPPARFPNLRVVAAGYGSVNVQIPAMYGEYRRDIVLVPEATIVGIVVDEAGQPVGGAIVSARPTMSDGKDEASSVDATAGADGRFQISGLTPMSYRLGATSEQGQTTDPPLVIAAAGAASRDVRVVVTRRATVSGVVTRDGQPVAGVQVADGREIRFGGAHVAAYTQADGSFELQNVTFGTMPVRVLGQEVTAPTTIAIHTTDVHGVAITVTPQASVSGRITRHGLPVAGAEVYCSLLPAAQGLSDGSGHYELVGLPPGNAVLFATDQRAFTNHPATLVAGEAQQIDLELDGGGVVKGVVVDEGGAPVSGVYVQLASPDRNDGCGSLTDERGGFDCETLAGHLDYQPTVYPSVGQQRAYAPATGDKLPTIHVDNGDSIVEHVQLAIRHDQLAIHGKVVDAAGATISDAHVTIEGAGGTAWGAAGRTRADVDGGFVVEGLAPGTYDLRAHTGDGSEGTVRGIAAGATGVVIQLVRPGSIEGTLVGFSRPPVIFARIASLGETNLFDAKVDGEHFTVAGLPPGSYLVDATLDGVQLDGAPVDVTTGAVARVTLRARARTTVTGRVVELGTGKPVAGMSCHASVSLGGSEAQIVGGSQQASATDASGQFSIEAPIGRDRIACSFYGEAWSEAGGDFDVGASPSTIEVVSVAQQPPPSDVGFALEPATIPPRVATAAPPMRAGDQLVAIDGTSVAKLMPGAAMMIATNHRPGAAITLQVVRAGARTTVQVVAR